MKCPNCGAEITANVKTCEFCGSAVSVQMQKELEQINKAGCPKCGSTNITFDREKQGEVKNKKGMTVVHSTIGLCKDCGYTWEAGDDSANKKSRKTWLWVLGWIFIFPLPLTILLLRKKEMKPAFKYGIIAAAWIVYILLAAFSGAQEEAAAEQSPVTQSVSQEYRNI